MGIMARTTKPPAPQPRPKSLTEISRLSPSNDEIDTLLSEIDTHNHRAAAVLGGAFVEDALEYAIQRRLVILTPKELGSMFEYPGPLSSFGAKIQLGYAIGLYGVIVRKDLDIIRRIRNAFAHAKKPISFDTPQVTHEMEKSQYLGWKDTNGETDYMSIVRTAPKTDSLHRYWYAILSKSLAHELFMLGKKTGLRINAVPGLP
jgi:hypothetical protein